MPTSVHNSIKVIVWPLYFSIHLFVYSSICLAPRLFACTSRLKRRTRTGKLPAEFYGQARGLETLLAEDEPLCIALLSDQYGFITLGGSRRRIFNRLLAPSLFVFSKLLLILCSSVSQNESNFE